MISEAESKQLGEISQILSGVDIQENEKDKLSHVLTTTYKYYQLEQIEKHIGIDWRHYVRSLSFSDFKLREQYDILCKWIKLQHFKCFIYIYIYILLSPKNNSRSIKSYLKHLESSNISEELPTATNRSSYSFWSFFSSLSVFITPRNANSKVNQDVGYNGDKKNK